MAGLLGFGLGKASYIRVCQSKFHSFEDQLRGAGFGPEHNRFVVMEGLYYDDDEIVYMIMTEGK